MQCAQVQIREDLKHLAEMVLTMCLLNSGSVPKIVKLENAACDDM